jgi:hypothetical protein
MKVGVVCPPGSAGISPAIVAAGHWRGLGLLRRTRRPRSQDDIELCHDFEVKSLRRQ